MNFVMSLLAGLASSTVLRAIVTRVMVLLGVSAVTYTGVSAAFSSIESMINTQLGSLPGAALSIIIMLKLPNCLDVIFSAYVGALTLRGLSAAGAITKLSVSSGPGTVFTTGS